MHVNQCFHKYILLGCITGATLLVGTLGLTLIEKSKETYVSSFKYNIPSIQNDKYLDGSNFDFQLVLSKSNIELLMLYPVSPLGFINNITQVF